MPHRSLSDLAWRLAAARRIPFDAPLDDPAKLADWIPARVPGTVQRDLMRAGRLPDLYNVLDLDETLAWVDDADWWYQVELPSIAPGARAWLRFDGIDYQAAVTLNGRELGRRAGMFSPREWEVGERLQAGPARLGVRVWGGGALPKWPESWRLRMKQALANRLQGGIASFSDRLLSLKAPVHYGWDFAPRLLAAGIWDDVWLHTARNAGIMDVWARADWGESRGLILRLEIDAAHTQPARLHAQLSAANFSENEVQDRTWNLALQPGRQSLALAWPEAQLRPWNTPDRGFPHLYHLRLRLADADGEMDETTIRVGSRTIGWDGYGRATPLVLNDERLRLRGANWAPLDLLSGDPQEPKRYRSLLQAAVDAGINALRVWGGGGRERRPFYDLCDELGLLVWQELPIACVFLDRLPEDEAFLQLARGETSGIVRMLRGHPSLMLWVGGNEWGPGRHKKLAAALGETVAQQDPSRRWLPASPGPGDAHNWRVWHGKAAPQSYSDDPAPLLSEFGLAAPPATPTLAAILPPDQLSPPGPAWESRKAEPEKLRSYAATQSGSEKWQSVDEFVSASQRAQARGLQAGMEAYRLRADAVGAFIWQWNEPWPAISWSIFPYKGPPKPAYEQIRRSFAPTAIIARILPETIELWVVNDRLQSPGLCQLTASLDGQTIWRGVVAPPANGSIRVAEIERPDVRLSLARPILELRLISPNFELVNDYDLSTKVINWKSLRLLAPIKEMGKRWLLRW
ncbi:MAG: hypothetical protein J5I90_16565 [Caldilineales bacterium]|nr:hypothetical protein [Caldilineales bacterium]